MKRYMIEVLHGTGWAPVCLCRTRQEAIQKAQYWEGAIRIVPCMR